MVMDMTGFATEEGEPQTQIQEKTIILDSNVVLELVSDSSDSEDYENQLPVRIMLYMFEGSKLIIPEGQPQFIYKLCIGEEASVELRSGAKFSFFGYNNQIHTLKAPSHQILLLNAKNILDVMESNIPIENCSGLSTGMTGELPNPQMDDSCQE